MQRAKITPWRSFNRAELLIEIESDLKFNFEETHV